MKLASYLKHAKTCGLTFCKVGELHSVRNLERVQGEMHMHGGAVEISSGGSGYFALRCMIKLC
jgi:hypothetical protein